jgi:GNAT superfamily N-acetyltransferase
MEYLMQICPAKPPDLEICGGLDHTQTTNRVWQMETRTENGVQTVSFREVRLPRQVQVKYPRRGDDLYKGWWQRDAFLVARDGEQIYGYIALNARPEHSIAWVGDLVVDRPQRRRGIGTALLHAAVQWGHKQGLNRLMIDVQTKNYPAIQFCRARGLTFSGYNDCYWPSQDIALFFGKTLR